MIIDKIVQARSYSSSPGKEKITRSILKTLSWRIIGTLDTVLITFLIVGELSTAISVGGVELITKMVLYFLHERAWNNIKWGNE
ncbi:MAG: DUF2061 domain-containing protein [Crocinitomicaceae bacterium]|nr:DUF2061 domain-containing protein [Flavobacteriales bacterium]NQZ34852.1 DUF2061 domain-containing protein [Crocinitomicaceae bacterium]